MVPLVVVFGLHYFCRL